MLHRIYAEINSDAGLIPEFITEKIFLKTGLSVKPERIRKVIEIEGSISKEVLNILKQTVATKKCEAVRIEKEKKDTKNAEILIMSRPGITDRISDEIADIIKLYSPGSDAKVTAGWEITLPDSFDKKYTESIYKALASVFKCASKPDSDIIEKKPEDGKYIEFADGFNTAKYTELEKIKKNLHLEMDMEDMVRVQNYFLSESREPTLTEMRIADRFFSEGFRHTTLNTLLSQVDCEDEAVKVAWDHYKSLKRNKNYSLADIARTANSYLETKSLKKATKKLNGIKIEGIDSGKKLLMLLKNENCNRSVMLSPYDGAANCLGGSVRDLLCALAYPFESARLYGYSDSKENIEKATEAAKGFSDYARGLGIPCSQNNEAVSADYDEKHFEFCVALALTDSEKTDELLKKNAKSGDLIFLLGGKTGRDGSTLMSVYGESGEEIEVSGEYVPVGKAGVLAAMQRLFNDVEFASYINSVNDVGSGGIVCAISEIASGVTINCDAVPLKYGNLSTEEIMLSESQERMVVAVSPENAKNFSLLCEKYNVSCAQIATVNDSGRFTITDGITNRTASLTHGFLMSEGYETRLGVFIEKQAALPKSEILNVAKEPVDKLKKTLKTLFVSAKKNFIGAMKLAEKNADIKKLKINNCIDETIGDGAVYLQNSPRRPEVSLRELNYKGKCVTKGGKPICSVIGSGVTCEINSISPYKSAYLSVTEAIMKLVVSGYGKNERYIAIQEYFPKHGNSSKRLGVLVSSMLGVFEAQMNLKTASIGGSGYIEKKHPSNPSESTIAIMGLCVGSKDDAITRDLKSVGSRLILIKPEIDHVSQLPSPEGQNKAIDTVNALVAEKAVLSGSVINADCVATEIIEICRASGKGVDIEKDCQLETLFDYFYGSALLEIAEGTVVPKNAIVIGMVTDTPAITYLDDSFPVFKELDKKKEDIKADNYNFMFLKNCISQYGSAKTVTEGKVNVLIPVTNYSVPADDIKCLFLDVGAEADTFIVGEHNISLFAEKLSKTDILYIPDGSVSSAFTAAVLMMPDILSELKSLKKRGGLIYGSGTSFDALIKSGLIELDSKKTGFFDNEKFPVVYSVPKIKATSTLSPFMRYSEPGGIFDTVVIGEKLRLMIDDDYVKELAKDGRILTMFEDDPIGGSARIDALCSKDGHVVGQISHPERIGDGLADRGCRALPFIRSCVEYFLK